MADQDRRVIVFRSRLRADITGEYERHAGDIFAIAEKMPGYVSIKDFTAEDGERVAIAEWRSPEELLTWRNEPSHAAAQTAGRERYYSEYAIDICAPVRGSRFDGTTRTAFDHDPAQLRAIAERWLACFERRDLDGLLALYADNATHTSPKIRVRHPETGGLLTTKAAMHAWWADSFARLPSMRYVPVSITADRNRVYYEYIRQVDGEPDMPVCEVLDVKDGLIIASRVFHG
jgi:heme-degrading monooxygenase HmoA/ketosteroid isomerase-like protein